MCPRALMTATDDLNRRWANRVLSLSLGWQTNLPTGIERLGSAFMVIRQSVVTDVFGASQCSEESGGQLTSSRTG
ncbi:MAG: hypothetical protein QOG47_132 [Mycobacterium sp.]|nr:hypothetical protein [Mycobacterium sp.]